VFCLNKRLVLVGIPIALSWVTVFNRSIALLLLFILAHFVILKVVTCFKKHESLWMFVLVAVTSIPINIYVLIQLHRLDMLFDSFFILGIFRCVLYYCILFSIEEIVMGVITRLIWKKQYKISLPSVQ